MKHAGKKSAKKKTSKKTGSTKRKASRKGTGNNKTKTEKKKQGTTNSNRNKSGKATRTKNIKPAGQNKRVSVKRSKVSKKGKIRKGKVPPVSVGKVKAKKLRGKHNRNLFVIPLPPRNIQDKVKVLQKAYLSNVTRFLAAQPVEPLYVFVTLKIKKPKEKGYFFNGALSPADMVVNTENSRAFAIEILVEYNNNMVDLIQETYDEIVRPYNVKEVSLRFLFTEK